MRATLTLLGLAVCAGAGRVGLRRAAPLRVGRVGLGRAAARPAAAPRAIVDGPEPELAHAALGPVVRAARAAIASATGAGEESSGSGRVEWGTWLDAELRWAVVDALNEVCVAAEGEAVWAQLLERFGPLDAPLALRIAGDEAGKRWDVLLHLLPAQSAEPPGAPGDVGRVVRPPTGSITLLRPLLGTTRITKLRLNRAEQLEPIGVSMEAAGAGYGSLGGGGRAENTSVVLGGLHQHTAGKLGRAALLEVALLPPHADAAERVPPLEPCARLPLDAEPRLGALFARLGDAEAQPAAESAAESARRLSAAGGAGGGGGARRGLSEQVGGLEAQLDAIVRRVLASRASPEAAARLGISHVRGILLSGPPGCGKTLLARELARQLGAREPQVVNGPEILSKFVGEAEANVRALFAPAAEEYAAAGAASALHVVILDEMDAIARTRGGSSGDTSGVRDSVVNQLLAQMDGVVAAPNVLVIGCTNRPELIDPALLRPGRLEVGLRVELPSAFGRREILRIHTSAMRQNGALAEDARRLIDGQPGADDGAEACLAARTAHFSGAELAGLVRSAASFALARAALALQGAGASAGEEASASSELASDAVRVRAADFERALAEVTPSLGKRDAELRARFAAHGVAPPSEAHAEAQRAILRFLASATSEGGAGVHSLLLVGEEPGAGVTAAGAWAAWLASSSSSVQYARLVRPLDLLGSADGGAARGAALADRFAEARAMGRAVLLLDDVDSMLAGAEPALGATLRSLLREPLAAHRPPGGEGGVGGPSAPPTLLVIGTCSSLAAARALGLTALFGSAVLLPRLGARSEAEAALAQSAELRLAAGEASALAQVALARGPVGVKPLLELATRACALADQARAEGQMEGLDALGLGGGEAAGGAAPSPAELRLRAMELVCGDWWALRQ